jgi:hypothetical protein
MNRATTLVRGKAGSSSYPQTSNKDPHTLEREAQGQKHLLEEEQYFAGTTGWK